MLCSDHLVDSLCEVCKKSVERFFICLHSEARREPLAYLYHLTLYRKIKAVKLTARQFHCLIFHKLFLFLFN